jgi:inosine/xanthosine triphosphate pyrophosphatase family protein
MTRLRRRWAFDALNARKLPNITFYTSSTPKFIQASVLFGAAGLKLTDRRHSADPYHESYAGTKEDLLAQAIEELKRREDYPATLFFVEDTSIRIDALSSESEDYPGLGAKEWFGRTSFADLEAQLKEHGDRGATVKSCIALSVPGLDHLRSQPFLPVACSRQFQCLAHANGSIKNSCRDVL